MKNTYLIDLSKNKELYHFTPEDISDDLIDEQLSEESKGELIEKADELTQNGGFLVIPSTQMVVSETESLLGQSNSRKIVLQNLLADRPIPGLLGVLNFKKESIDKIQTIEISPTRTLDIAEDYLEESLSIDFGSGLPTQEEQIDIDLNIYGLNSEDTKGINDGPVSGGIKKLDVISEAIFYDESEKEIYREFLIPETIDQLNRNGVVVNLNNQLEKPTKSTKSRRKKRGIIKKIVVIVRKFIKNVRKTVNNLKAGGINLVIKGLQILSKSNNRYKLLKYEPTSKTFQTFKHVNQATINPDLRTLIFIHGTVNGSFDGRGFNKKKKGKGSFHYLYDNKFKGFDHWIDYLLNQKAYSAPIQYEQVLALEHETLVDDPEENIRIFYEDLGFKQLKFTQPISIICASRGNFIAKQLSISDMTKVMDIERVAIVSGGYSDYLEQTESIKKFVNSLGRLFKMNQTLRFLLSLSIDIIAALPGVDVHKKSGTRFLKLIEHPNDVCYFNMVNVYRGRSIIKNPAKKYLGPENDLLLSLHAQKDHRPGYEYPIFPDFLQGERHGNALRTPGAKMALFYFLVGELAPLEMSRPIDDSVVADS